MRTCIILLSGWFVTACGEPATGMPDGVYRVTQSEIRVCGDADWAPCDGKCLGTAGWIHKAPHYGHFGAAITITPCSESAPTCDTYMVFGPPDQPQTRDGQSSPFSDEDGCALGLSEHWFEPTPADAPAALTVHRRRYTQTFPEQCAEAIDLSQAGCFEERTRASYVHR